MSRPPASPQDPRGATTVARPRGRRFKCTPLARLAPRLLAGMCAVLSLVGAHAVRAAGDADPPSECTYETYRWNVTRRAAVDHRLVRHPYAELVAEEIDAATGCSVCREDQVRIELASLPPFHVCRVFAGPVREILTTLLNDGVPIHEVTGYRVGKTRGEPDAKGNRTRFSNHSFGVALDVNADFNGLYDHCLDFGPHCRLIRGGPWRPDDTPASLHDDGPVVRAMRSIGLRWGGTITGRQKDFMHFSPSGY